MALGALPVVMPRRPTVARLAIRQSLMRQICALPGAGFVTLRALPTIVPRGSAMAGLTILCPCCLVIKGCRLPGTHIVAGRTLCLVVVGRFIRSMARAAVGGQRLGVVEVDVAPAVWGVAGSAIPIEMHHRLHVGMTGLALGGCPGKLPCYVAAFTGECRVCA